jgi:hypothetical protein
LHLIDCNQSARDAMTIKEFAKVAGAFTLQMTKDQYGLQGRFLLLTITHYGLIV